MKKIALIIIAVVVSTLGMAQSNNWFEEGNAAYNEGDYEQALALYSNIENAGFTPTVCAERTAFFKAVYDGHRAFRAIAVIATGEEMGFPCGVCRQVMAEFCEKDFVIITANRDRSQVDVSAFEQLLPHSFGPKDLIV